MGYKSFDKSATAGPSANASNTMTNVLLVGQIYIDTILTVDTFPEEDSKLRASQTTERCGGNIGNTGEVLAQFPKVNVYCMSAVGPKETSSALISELTAKGIKTPLFFYRQSPTPASYIIQSKATGSRTIISNNVIEDITREEFAHKLEMTSITKTLSFESDCNIPFSWVHFEGRNIKHVVKQIDWLDAKATREGWRSKLTISVELEKPDREGIDRLTSKGDVMFFSKLFAEKRGYTHPSDFLRAIQPRCKPSAVLFCTWGSKGATCLPPNGREEHASALPIRQVEDPIGAGDTFIAGIIFTLSRGYPYLTALRFACELASRKVAQTGFAGLASVMAKVWDTPALSSLAQHGGKPAAPQLADELKSDSSSTLAYRMSSLSTKPILSPNAEQFQQ